MINLPPSLLSEAPCIGPRGFHAFQSLRSNLVVCFGIILSTCCYLSRDKRGEESGMWMT